MHPSIVIGVVIISGAALFWAVLALVGRMQKGKKKNFPPLDSTEINLTPIKQVLTLIKCIPNQA